MEDALASTGAVVHDEPEIVAVTRVARDPRGREYELPGEPGVVEVREPLDVPARNDEHMKRRARVEVIERDDVVVLVDEPRRQLLRDDPAEDALRHAGTVPACPTRSPSLCRTCSRRS